VVENKRLRQLQISAGPGNFDRSARFCPRWIDGEQPRLGQLIAQLRLSVGPSQKQHAAHQGQTGPTAPNNNAVPAHAISPHLNDVPTDSGHWTALSQYGVGKTIS